MQYLKEFLCQILFITLLDCGRIHVRNLSKQFFQSLMNDECTRDFNGIIFSEYIILIFVKQNL